MGNFRIRLAFEGDTILSKMHRVKGFVREHVANQFGYYVIVVRQELNKQITRYLDNKTLVESCRILLTEKMGKKRKLLIERMYAKKYGVDYLRNID